MRPKHSSLPTATAFPYEHGAYAKLMHSLRFSDFDIIHNNSLHYLPIALAHLLPMPMVTTLHTPPFWEMAGSILLGGRTNRFFVAVSPAIAQAWSSITRVDQVIFNGVDLQKFAYNPQPHKDPYMVWTGRIVPEKGLHFANDAANIAGLPLAFAGPIADRGYFESEILPRMEGNIRYAGHLCHDKLIALIANAQVCLCTPNWEEPYGLVVAEALACGTPVAAFARGALPSLLDASLRYPGRARQCGRPCTCRPFRRCISLAAIAVHRASPNRRLRTNDPQLRGCLLEPHRPIAVGGSKRWHRREHSG